MSDSEYLTTSYADYRIYGDLTRSPQLASRWSEEALTASRNLFNTCFIPLIDPTLRDYCLSAQNHINRDTSIDSAWTKAYSRRLLPDFLAQNPEYSAAGDLFGQDPWNLFSHYAGEITAYFEEDEPVRSTDQRMTKLPGGLALPQSWQIMIRERGMTTVMDFVLKRNLQELRRINPRDTDQVFEVISFSTKREDFSRDHQAIQGYLELRCAFMEDARRIITAGSLNLALILNRRYSANSHILSTIDGRLKDIDTLWGEYNSIYKP